MIKRIALLDITTAADGTRSPAVQPEATAWVCLHDFGGRMLVKFALPDGTPTAAGWLADITMVQQQDGSWQQTDVTATTLTNAQRTAITTFLTNRGLNAAWIDATLTDRKKLLFALLGSLANRADMDLELLLRGHDAG